MIRWGRCPVCRCLPRADGLGSPRRTLSDSPSCSWQLSLRREAWPPSVSIHQSRRLWSFLFRSISRGFSIHSRGRHAIGEKCHRVGRRYGPAPQSFGGPHPGAVVHLQRLPPVDLLHRGLCRDEEKNKISFIFLSVTTGIQHKGKGFLKGHLGTLFKNIIQVDPNNKNSL